MANFTVEILTWSNVERGKGKPTHHLFSTHISTIFVHGGVFSGVNRLVGGQMSANQEKGSGDGP